MPGVLKARVSGAWVEVIPGSTGVDQTYVDLEVTVSTSAPVGAPARDGILWVVVP